MDRILQAAESSCGVSALTGEETALENRDYEKILNAMPETGVYVIREDNHGLLYFNKRVQQLSPEAQPGMSCRQVWTGSCANCPLRTVKGRNESRSLSYNALFGGVVDMTAARILWEDAIPAFMVTVTPRIEAASYIYQKILRINLSQNRYDVLKSDESVWLSEAGSENLSAELQQFTAGDIVHPDDLNRIASFTNPKHLQEALSSGRTMLTCAYRRRHNGTFRRVLIEAVRGFDYSPENQTAIFCVKDVQDAMQEDLDLEETPKDVQIQTLQDRAYIISSLSSLFFSTYYINLENDTFRTVIQLSKIGDVLGSEVNCTAAFQVYAKNFIHPDDREEYLRIMDVRYLRETLRWWKPNVSVYYRIIPDNPKTAPNDCRWIRATAVLAQTGEDDMPKTAVYVAQDITFSDNLPANRNKMEEINGQYIGNR